MPELVFSTWNNTVIDNRGKPEGEKDSSGLHSSFPTQLSENRPLRSIMGWDGIVLFDDGADPVALALAFLEAVQTKASCGECFPCRVGTRIMLHTLRRIASGKGKPQDLQELRSLAEDVRDASKCQIGQTSPVPILHLLDYFQEELDQLIRGERTVEAASVIARITAPCIDACPAHLDIPTYVEHIGRLRPLDSLDRIRRDNTMPATCGRVCVRPCEFHCRRGLVDESIAIKQLKRFVTDYETEHRIQPPFHKTKSSGGKAAIVGAGPAGLAAAFNLAKLGHVCTIFETLPEPGGMAAVGIPDYRLPREVIKNEVDVLLSLGVEFRYGQRLGRDFFLTDLTSEMGYDAAFVAVGAHNSRKMGVTGEEEDYEGFVHGVHWLRDLNLGNPVFTAKKLVAVGGGNVAIDVVRCALRKGFEDVNLVYRRSRKEMPADAEEIEDAEEEGIGFHFLTNPVRLLAENGKLTGVECIRMELGEPDKSGRRRPVPVGGSEFVIECDAVIPAIGQIPDMSWVKETDGLAITRWETIEADPITMQTGVPQVFTAGDCFTGPDTLIGAIGGGNRAAFSMDRLFQGKKVEPTQEQLLEIATHKMGTYDPKEAVGIVKGITRRKIARQEPAVRIHHFDEVESRLSAKDAIAEARRCLRCYRLTVVQE